MFNDYAINIEELKSYVEKETMKLNALNYRSRLKFIETAVACLLGEIKTEEMNAVTKLLEDFQTKASNIAGKKVESDVNENIRNATEAQLLTWRKKTQNQIDIMEERLNYFENEEDQLSKEWSARLVYESAMVAIDMIAEQMKWASNVFENDVEFLEREGIRAYDEIYYCQQTFRILSEMTSKATEAKRKVEKHVRF